jgi:hypothetical protein
MLPSVTIEVTFPEALDAVIIQTIVARKGSRVVFTLLAAFLGLDDLSIGDLHQHGLVLQPSSPAVHVFEALEAEIVFAICTENLWLLADTGGAKTTNGCLQGGVILTQPNRVLVQRIETGLAERHQALVALQLRLHHGT